MNALGEFVQQQMDARGWRQVDLVRASGLTKQVVSHLCKGGELRRMIEPATVKGLAKAFQVDESLILVKAAEAVGVPVNKLAPIVLTAHDEPDEVLIEILKNRLLSVRTGTVGCTNGLDTPSDPDPAPNRSGVDSGAGAGGGQVSGETVTSGDFRDPRRRTRGSDETLEQRPMRSDAHPHLL